jgi:uncharacterized LabA/DUF88 family protein
MPNSKVAILIDGGFFVQRFKQINVTKNCPTRENVEALITDIIKQVQTKTGSHSTDTLLRTFYYDCQPFAKTIKNIQGKSIDFSLSAVYATQMAYLNSLKTIDQFALRLGQLSFGGWKLNTYKPVSPPYPDFNQKGVDMKIGLDMAWMAGRKTVDKIALVTGDSDFISPIKLARREGILIYLFTLGAKTLKSELTEHADFIL